MLSRRGVGESSSSGLRWADVSPRRLRILPCPDGDLWSTMAKNADGSGDCARCGCRVHDGASLSEDELEELLGQSSDRVCLRSELVGGHPRLATGLMTGLVVAALGCAGPQPESAAPSEGQLVAAATEMGQPVEGRASITGVVRDQGGDPIQDAIVVLQSVALEAPLERMTDARGLYAFHDLPPGNYTVQVLARRANVSKITQLPAGARFRANFSLDPKADVLVGMVVRTSRVTMDASSTYHSSMIWPE